jgi:predicted enzyme related to lactoylglutathione lyase
MSVKNIAFTMYPVSDITRAVAFYAEGLGLQKSGIDSPAWVEFEIGGGTFGVGNFEQIGKPGTAQSLALEVTDMESFRKTLAGRGIESSEAHETPVCWISMVKDPDGNVIALHQSKHA